MAEGAPQRPDPAAGGDCLAAPGCLDYFTVNWTVTKSVPRAIIPVNRVEEFKVNESRRLGVEFIRTHKGLKEKGKNVRSARTNARYIYNLPYLRAQIPHALSNARPTC